MIEVYNKLESEKMQSELILQIHDELIVDVYPGEMDKVTKILQDTMQNVVSLDVPLIVSVGKGKSLFECKD